MESILEAIQILQAEARSYSQPVQVWMKVMGVSFISSVLFIFWRSSARWILAIVIVNLVGLVIGKMLWPDASRSLIGTVVHLLFWPPLLWMAWRSHQQQAPASRRTRVGNSIYIVWFYWVSALVLISLVLDLRQAFLGFS